LVVFGVQVYAGQTSIRYKSRYYMPDFLLNYG